MAPRSTPAFIGAILAAPVTRYLVLLALACPFALSAVFKLGAWPGAVRTPKFRLQRNREEAELVVPILGGQPSARCFAQRLGIANVPDGVEVHEG